MDAVRVIQALLDQPDAIVIGRNNDRARVHYRPRFTSHSGTAVEQSQETAPRRLGICFQRRQHHDISPKASEPSNGRRILPTRDNDRWRMMLRNRREVFGRRLNPSRPQPNWAPTANERCQKPHRRADPTNPRGGTKRCGPGRVRRANPHRGADRGRRRGLGFAQRSCDGDDRQKTVAPFGGQKMASDRVEQQPCSGNRWTQRLDRAHQHTNPIKLDVARQTAPRSIAHRRSLTQRRRFCGGSIPALASKLHSPLAQKFTQGGIVQTAYERRCALSTRTISSTMLSSIPSESI